MKKNMYIFIFVLSLFFLTRNVNADYKAITFNPSGATCNLYSGSTGYCFYKDSKLNSYVSGSIWLDTGDVVTVLTDYKPIDSPDKSLCSDYYVYVSYYFDKKSATHKGYYCHNNLSTESKLTDELKEEFKSSGFPESYWESLAILKSAHPSWIFKAINTDLDFNEVVSNENIASRSLIQVSSSNNYAYMSYDTSSFDYKNDKFIVYDSTTWYNANYDAIAYYVDPRNFLKDMYIFQFQSLKWNDNLNDEQLKGIIEMAFKGDYLLNFTDIFVATKLYGVDPIYLASLSKQEVGGHDYPNTAIAGTNSTYPNIYNFYNIGASSSSTPVLNGLKFASNTDEATDRPWNTPEKAIIGGAKWIYNHYVSIGQETSYFKKWDVVYNYLVNQNIKPSHKNYTHQYMTNIMAPSSEATTTYKSYFLNNLLDLNYTFEIPVYKNMPASTSLPNVGGWPNNYLKSIKLNNVEIADFDGDVTIYNYDLNNTNTLKIEAESVSSLSNISGVGTFEINEDTQKEIIVTAQNGNIKKYILNITLTNTEPETKDIVSTLNTAGIKNGTYLYGFNIGTDISIIKTKINNINNEAIVKLSDSMDNEKLTGIICTGDKVAITIDNITKIYEIIIYGDINGDGEIKPSDYAMIKDSLMGKISLSGSKKEAADIDKNGEIKPSDYARVKDSIMGSYTIIQ